MITLKIEKNIPLPEPHRKYPLHEMEIGDSFLIPGKESTKNRPVAYAICMYRKKYPLKKFSIRKVTGGVRCWRVE